MDPFIAQYHFERKNGLCYCESEGVAYQPDMSQSVEYDRPYFEKYVMYESTPMGEFLNLKRCDVVKSWSRGLKIIDIGIGCGSFVKQALSQDLKIYGFDINPCAINWLHKHAIFRDPYKDPSGLMCWTFWDSLEHIPEPQKLFEKIPVGAFVFISMPIFQSLNEIIKSRHYRPDEHYYYFTAAGFNRWMRNYNFQLIRIYDFETAAGRNGIKTFAFERVVKIKAASGRELLSEYFSEQNRNSELLGDKLISNFNLEK